MKNLGCEEYLIQKIAVSDGERTDLSDGALAAHFENCENCRREFAQLENARLLIARHERRTPDADLWAAIEKRIGAASPPPFAIEWRPFVLVGVLLVVYKLLELLPDRDFGWTLKFVPIALIIALFGFLKENPFKINTEMILEK